MRPDQLFTWSLCITISGLLLCALALCIRATIKVFLGVKADGKAGTENEKEGVMTGDLPPANYEAPPKPPKAPAKCGVDKGAL